MLAPCAHPNPVCNSWRKGAVDLCKEVAVFDYEAAWQSCHYWQRAALDIVLHLAPAHVLWELYRWSPHDLSNHPHNPPQVVDSTADSLKRTQAAADEARREIEAPPAAAPFARTPLTKLPPVPDKDVPVSAPSTRPLNRELFRILIWSPSGLPSGALQAFYQEVFRPSINSLQAFHQEPFRPFTQELFRPFIRCSPGPSSVALQAFHPGALQAFYSELHRK